MKKNKYLLILLIFFLILLIFIIYFKISLEDDYFTYWDPYVTKSESLILENSTFNSFRDPLFFYNVLIFQKITSTDFYYIIKYGSFLMILLLFVYLSYLVNNIFNPKNYTDYVIIFFSILLFVISRYAINRFSMTLRENLIFPILILSIFIICKNFNNDKIKYNQLFLISIISTYIIGGHILAGFILISSLITNLIIKLNNKIIIKKTLFILILTLIISSIFLFYYIDGIIYQISHSNQLIEKTGYNLDYFFIKKTNFHEFEFIILILGGFVLIKDYINRKPFNSFFLSYIIVIISAILLSYISIFASKQNRFLIYLGLIIISLKIVFIKQFKFNKKILTSIMAIILIIAIFPALEINGYRPIKLENINAFNNISNNYKYKEYLCGQTSTTVSKYLGNVKCIVINSTNIDNPEYPILIYDEDLISYKLRFPDIYLNINEIMEDDNYDKEGGLYLIIT